MDVRFGTLCTPQTIIQSCQTAGNALSVALKRIVQFPEPETGPLPSYKNVWKWFAVTPAVYPIAKWIGIANKIRPFTDGPMVVIGTGWIGQLLMTSLFFILKGNSDHFKSHISTAHSVYYVALLTDVFTEIGFMHHEPGLAVRVPLAVATTLVSFAAISYANKDSTEIANLQASIYPSNSFSLIYNFGFLVNDANPPARVRNARNAYNDLEMNTTH